jgi:hypothetical protein
MTPTDDDFSGLPREMRPPPELENRVVASLRSEGLLGRPGASPLRWATYAAAAAALFFGGYGVGAGDRPTPDPPPQGNRYAILLYEDDAFVAAPPDDPARHVREYGAWAETLAARGALDDAGELATGGVSLMPVADGGVAESPAPESNESAVTGFFIVRAEDTESALELARTHPHLANRGRVDVHAVVARGGG